MRAHIFNSPFRTLALAFFIGSALGIPATAQAPSAQDQGFPLQGLRITGNRGIPGPRIIDALGLTIGQPINQAGFDAARDRLLATGAFEEVGYSYQPSASGTGYDATFEVIELQPLYAYRFEELPLPEAELRAALADQELLFDDRIPGLPEIMNRYAAALRRTVTEKTGNELEIIGEMNNDLPGGIMILFRPAGRRPNISTVDFVGNEILPIYDLRLAMNETAVGEPFSEGLFRQMLDLSIRPLYDKVGRVRVAFPEIRTTPSEQNRGIDVIVAIEEGPEYRLGRIDIENSGPNALPGDQTQEMLRAGGWKTGEVANFDEIAAGVARLKKEFENNGYLRVDAPVERTIDDDAHVVNLTITVDPGERYSMGNLEIVGLDIFSEPVIRKLWLMEPGSPYQDRYPDNFIQNIVNQGVFDNLGRTGAEADIHDDTLTVDVTLTFEGARVVPEDQRIPR